jgi:2,3-diaminopropionate biosynthesis protein SbnA
LKTYKNIHSAYHRPFQLDYGIGNTPLQPVIFSIQGIERTVYLKLEGSNPTHSMKDRTAYALIRALEERDTFHSHSTIVESTSGNLGVALARLCQLKGPRFIAVVDPKTTSENIARMQDFGAQVHKVQELDQSGGYLLTRLAYIQDLLKDHSDYFWTDQYTNVANPHIHSISTGPEIYEQMEQEVEAVFIPVSTGGTLAGVSRFFRQVEPSVEIIGVDAVGSVVFGTPAAPRKLTGIGSSRSSSFLQKTLYNEYRLIKDEEAFAFCHFLLASTGISVGGSSGAVLAACARYLVQHPEKTRVVCVCADHGETYTSSIFNDAWLQEQNVHLSPLDLGSVDAIYCHPTYHPYMEKEISTYGTSNRG